MLVWIQETLTVGGSSGVTMTVEFTMEIHENIKVYSAMPLLGILPRIH